MFTKSIFLCVSYLALAHARFGQENAVQNIISAIGGNGGAAATLAGQSIGTLLAGANACAKLSLADEVAALDGAGALNAAKALVQAEKNFNPFAVTIPSFCSDASLPATEALRGILPLVDPDLDGAAAQNAASAASLNAPVDAAGLSIADIVQGQGSITDFTAQAADGAASTVGGGGAAAADAGAPTGADDGAAGDNANSNNGGNGNDNTADNANENTGNGNDNAAADTGVNNGNGNNANNQNNGNNNANNNNGNNANNNNGNANNGNDNAADDATAATGADTSTNLQTFTSAVGAAADPITFSGNPDRPFNVAGSTFANFAAAAARSCDRQFNACANGANGGDGNEVADCTAQKDACTAAQADAPVTSFAARMMRGRRRVRSRREAGVTM
ncbi:hypothetical protein DFP73DRAFT_629863 [Morchella snyderi]|nr:hypothetical protein DFP73DRAFT_629863 [Morchella snyderi]